MGSRDLTFVIADDHGIVRDVLKALVEENGFRVLGLAADGNEAVRLCQQLKPNVAVLDISMPQLNGIEAAREIQRRVPGISIILLTAHSEVPYVEESLRAGVAGYVIKARAASCLLEAIDAVSSDRTYANGISSPAPRSVSSAAHEDEQSSGREHFRWSIAPSAISLLELRLLEQLRDEDEKAEAMDCIRAHGLGVSWA